MRTKVDFSLFVKFGHKYIRRYVVCRITRQKVVN